MRIGERVNLSPIFLGVTLKIINKIKFYLLRKNVEALGFSIADIDYDDFCLLISFSKYSAALLSIDKEGGFIRAYSAEIVRAANDFDVQESSGEIFVLSGNKIFRIDI